MKKAGLFLLAVVMVTGWAGCSKDKDDYDFNGTWSGFSTVVESNLPGVPVGLQGVDTIVITQSGTNISGVLDGDIPLSGTCDPSKGTFSMTGSTGPVIYGMAMQKEDKDTLSGTTTITAGPYIARFTTTMNLVSRNKSAVMTGGNGDGMASSLIRALNPAP